jgi:NAD+ kinase
MNIKNIKKEAVRRIGLAVHRERPEAQNLAKELQEWVDSQKEEAKILLTQPFDKRYKKLWEKGEEHPEDKLMEDLYRDIERWEPYSELRILTSEKDIKKAQVILSLGGDGLFAKTARQFAPYLIPILGVDVGGLGYLNKVEGTLEACQQAIRRLLQGDYEIETRTILKGSVFCQEEEVGSIEALNEIVLRSSKLELIEIAVSINSTFFISYSGDGVLLSTPTGATAYSKSTGGPLITDPEKVKCFILNPLAPHTLPLPPILISEEDKVTFELIKGKEVFVASDAVEFRPSDERFFLQKGDKVVVQKADTPAFLIKFPEIPPFQALHDKFQLIERAALGR